MQVAHNSPVEREQQIVAQMSMMAERLETFTITTLTDAQIAVDMLNEVAAQRARIVEWFRAIKEPAHLTWRAICTREKAALERCDVPDRLLRTKLSTWHAEETAARAVRDAEHGHPLTALLVQPEPQRLEGVAFVEQWSVEVTDLKALALAVAEGRVPQTLIEANLSALTQLARALRTGFSVPGCRAISTQQARRTAA